MLSFLQHDFIYVTVLNIFDDIETINLKESFTDLTEQMKVVMVSTNSKLKVG